MSQTIEAMEFDTDDREPLRLRVAIAYYAAALLVLAAAGAAWFFVPWFAGLALIGTYLALGVALNRLVLAQLVSWHPVYDTVGAIAGAKFRFIVMWPLNYAALLAQLVVNRIF